MTRLLTAAALLALVVSFPGPVSARTAKMTPATTVPLTITTPRRALRLRVEVARTSDQQARGLMFRRSLPANGGMIFPMRPPRVASFWMKNTVIPLDMIFIRADGTIARVAANTVPYTLDPVTSGEPVAAVLEIAAGRAARLGIDERARVALPR